MTTGRHSNAYSQSDRHVWIVNHYAAVPWISGGAGRHFFLAQQLKKLGWSSTIILASTDHPAGRQLMPGRVLRKRATAEGIEALLVRTNAYGNSLALRLIGMLLFAVNLLRPGTCRGLQRPDVVIGSTVHPFAAYGAFRLSRRYGVPFVYEIRDVWPESLVDISGLSLRHPVVRLFSVLDRLLIKSADLVISPLPHVDLHLAEMGYPDVPFLWISNGYDIEGANGSPDLVNDRHEFTFMYLGAHGKANAIEDLLVAFDKACRAAPERNLKFRLVGDGPSRSSLIRFALGLSSANRIEFEERIPAGEVMARARESDCLVVNLPDRPVYRFGVALNKYFFYLATGVPIISASSAPNNPISDAKAGYVVPGGDVDEISSAMCLMASLSKAERAAFAGRGVSELRGKYSFEVLGAKLADALSELVAQ